jgi:hypothetical protein
MNNNGKNKKKKKAIEGDKERNSTGIEQNLI